MKRRNTSIIFLCLALANRGGHAFQPSQPIHKRIRRRYQVERLPFPTFANSKTTRLQALSQTSPASKTRSLEKKVTALGRSGKTDEALQLYYSIECPSTRLVNCAIDVCARARPPRLEEAFSLLETAVKEKNLRVNVFTFGSLMNVCNRARNADKALELLRSFEQQHGVAPNEVVYSSAISACARSQPPKTQEALNLLREAVEEKELQMSVTGFNAAISACAQAVDWKSAIKLLDRMEEASEKAAELRQQKEENGDEEEGEGADMQRFLVPEPDLVTYGTILSACERGEQWSLVLNYAKKMQKRGLKLDGLAVTSCLHACQQLGLAEEALNYLEQMRNVHPVAPITAKLQRSGAKRPLQGPDAVAYRLAISACARGGAWKEGIRLLQTFEQETGVAPDVVAYTSAITGCEYAGKWKEAFHLLDRMRKAGVEPNEVTMAAVIGACAKALSKGETEIDDEEEDLGSNEAAQIVGTAETMPLVEKKALQLLALMKKIPTMVDPNIQVYNAAIRVCAEACDLKRAFRLLEEVRELGIERTEITYGSMMTACQRVGDIQSVSKVFQMLKEDEIVPNEIIYGAAISCCRKSKESERALLLLRKMMKEGLNPNVATLNTVLMAQAESRGKGDYERAVMVYKIMKSRFVEEGSRPNRRTYNILVNLFASSRQPFMAEAFLKKMREDGYKPDVDLFTATVAAYERTGQPLKAVQLMESMQEDGYDFYSVKALDTAFKKAIKLVNKVGKSLSSSEASSAEEQKLKYVDLDVEIDEL